MADRFEKEPSMNRNRQLHICPKCASNLVQPTCWEQAEGRGNWRIWLRCPECEHTEDTVASEPEIDVFDEKLDLGTKALSDALKNLEHENMEFVADRFEAAMERDLITADDFLPHGNL